MAKGDFLPDGYGVVNDGGDAVHPIRKRVPAHKQPVDMPPEPQNQKGVSERSGGEGFQPK